MLEDTLGTLKLLSALGCGLMAGVFFAFSTFVMNALEGLPPAHGISAMQRINVAVINPLFMAAFLGTAAACALLAVFSLSRLRDPGARYVLIGSALYLVGTVLVTMACNVPRNDALAAVDPASLDSARLWAAYVRGWTAWNHVRGAAALLAAALLVIGGRVS
jgi:uncharacterized membrane protein